MRKFALMLVVVVYIGIYILFVIKLGREIFLVEELPKVEVVPKHKAAAIIYQFSEVDTILYTDKAILIHLK